VVELFSLNGDSSLDAPLDHGKINSFSKFIGELDSNTKQAIAIKITQCMVRCSHQNLCNKFLEESFSGYKVADGLRKRNKPGDEMIEEKLPSQPSQMENRKKLLCKYLAVLLSHEMLWEAALFTEIPETLDFYRELLELIKGDEPQTVAFI
jgi:hypothetical protein